MLQVPRIRKIWVQDPVKIDIDKTFPKTDSATQQPTRQYQLLPWMQKVLDSIPIWLNLLFAVIGCNVGVILAQTNNYTSNISMVIFAVAGFFAGLFFLRLSAILVYLTVQFTIVLVKIAIVLGIVGSIAYAILKWIGP